MKQKSAVVKSQPRRQFKGKNLNRRTGVKDRKALEMIGPVEDLESYVKAEWWRDVFNANYLKTDGDVVNDPEITDREISAFIELLGMSPSARILDLCCGQGRHTLALAGRGYRDLTGLDRSHYLISKARKSAKQEGVEIAFREGDARKLPFSDDSFDFVLIPGNSFGYFESAKEDELVLREIHRVLKPGGRTLLDITDGDFLRDHYHQRSWEWIDRNYFVCRERSLSDDQSRLISREVITHTGKGVVSDQFYAERLYNESQMIELLERSGYVEVEHQEPFYTESRRNQDLGMMARRIFYMAKAKKQWASQCDERSDVRKVAVVLGDPRRSDMVKPNGMFDEDDFAVVERLRKALAGMKGYQFSCFDNHDNLIADCSSILQDFDCVLNLCDEGFDNRATWELHVPALLEMCKIPYTGGTPQCLAFCYDKSLVRGVAKEMDIPVPEAFLIQPDESSFHEMTIPFPVIVKPNFGDSSVGITQRSVCHNIRQLGTTLREIREHFGYEKPILIEQFLAGKDISVGFIGNMPDSLSPLPVVEEDYSMLPEGLPKICGYEAKWDPRSPYWGLRSIAAGLPDDVEGFLINSCRRLFERLECRDYARFDWRLDQHGTPRLLEVNPNPGWCWDGHLAKMAALEKSDYRDMLRRILEAAFERIEKEMVKE